MSYKNLTTNDYQVCALYVFLDNNNYDPMSFKKIIFDRV